MIDEKALRNIIKRLRLPNNAPLPDIIADLEAMLPEPRYYADYTSPYGYYVVRDRTKTEFGGSDYAVCSNIPTRELAQAIADLRNEHEESR